MFEINWTNLQLYHYLAIGGGAVAVLALLLYFVMPKGLRIPAGVIGTVAGLVAGIGVGVIGMAASGYQFTKGDPTDDAGPPNAAAGPPGGMPVAGKGFPAGMAGGAPPGGGMAGGPPGGGMFGGKGGKAGGGKKGFGAVSDKAQLALLVAKLDQLTDNSLTLKLTPEQRTMIRDQLKDLPEQDEVSDEEAKKRLDAILDSLKEQRAVLEAAGYRWPGTPFAMTPPTPPNPFKDGPDSAKLNSLQEKLKK